ENAEYELKVKEVNIAPNPIARGEPATFTISANTGKDDRVLRSVPIFLVGFGFSFCVRFTSLYHDRKMLILYAMWSEDIKLVELDIKLVEQSNVIDVPGLSYRNIPSNVNALSKTQVFGKEAARNQFLGFTVINYRVCSLRLELQGIHNYEGDMVNQSTNNLVVWNPYLGQTRCIPPASSDIGLHDMFGFGYDKNNRNHRILRFFYDKDHPLFYFELFDFKTSSWRFLDIEPDFDLDFCQTGVSVKGNTYFVAQHNTAKLVNVLLCFDFTTERFCQPLPFHYTAEFENVALSCVGEEKLAVLYKHEGTMEIWITTNIEHDAVSWSKFLKVEMIPLNGFPDDFGYNTETLTESFHKPTKSHQICYSQTAHIIGQDGYLKSVRIGESRNHVLDEPLVFSSYVPSLVQLGINQEEHTKVALIKGKERKHTGASLVVLF
ncbi:hypothetical protein HID58_086765, partial [Brassica napus]